MTLTPAEQRVLGILRDEWQARRTDIHARLDPDQHPGSLLAADVARRAPVGSVATIRQLLGRLVRKGVAKTVMVKGHVRYVITIAGRAEVRS